MVTASHDSAQSACIPCASALNRLMTCLNPEPGLTHKPRLTWPPDQACPPRTFVKKARLDHEAGHSY